MKPESIRLWYTSFTYLLSLGRRIIDQFPGFYVTRIHISSIFIFGSSEPAVSLWFQVVLVYLLRVPSLECECILASTLALITHAFKFCPPLKLKLTCNFNTLAWILDVMLIALVSNVTLLVWLSNFAQCWLPCARLNPVARIPWAPSTAQILKVTLIEWLLELTLLALHQVFTPYVGILSFWKG